MQFQQTPGGYRLTLTPARTRTGFLALWMAGASVGEVFALSALLFHGTAPWTQKDLFLLVWTVGWTMAVLAVARELLWDLAGSEVVEVTGDRLVLSRRYLGWTPRPRSYRAGQVGRLRVLPAPAQNEFSPSGRLGLDVGNRNTVSFAHCIADRDAEPLFNTLSHNSPWLLEDPQDEGVSTSHLIVSHQYSVRERRETLHLTVRTRRQLHILLLLPCWLVGWAIGEQSALHTLAANPLNLFMLLWIGLWTYGGVAAVVGLLWQIDGREVMELTPNGLRVSRRCLGLGLSRTYPREALASLRLEGDSLVFDYRGKKVGLGSDLNHAEAAEVLELLQRDLG